MKTVGKAIATIAVFIAAIAISSAVFDHFFGYYPALTTIAALLITSPFAFLMWRDRFAEPPSMTNR